MRRIRRGWPLAVVAMLALSACQRSAGYRQDQDYTQSDMPASYYSSVPGKSPVQRVESMGQPKKRVFVLDFWNDTPVHQADIGAFAANELKRGLYATGRVIVPIDLHTDLGTENFLDPNQNGKLKVAQLVREGRRMGISLLLVGRVSKIVYRQRGDDVGLLRQKQSLCAVELELKVFDVNQGRELMADSKSGESSSNALVAVEGSDMDNAESRAELTRLAVRNTANLMIPGLIKTTEKLTWQGHIAKVAGKKIYINAGHAAGLVNGDILRVLSPGDDIYDPQTGAYLGRSKGQVKGTLEIVDFLGTDGAVAEIHTGGNFQEGDAVFLY